LRAAARGLIRAGVAGAANVAIGYGLSYFTCTPYSFENGLFDFGFGGLTGLGSFRSPTVRFAAEDAGVVFRSDTSHIFRNATGHLAEDTAENRALLQGAVKPENLVGTRGPGGSISVSRELLPDGRQVWVEVRNGTSRTAVSMMSRGHRRRLDQRA